MYQQEDHSGDGYSADSFVSRWRSAAACSGHGSAVGFVVGASQLASRALALSRAWRVPSTPHRARPVDASAAAVDSAATVSSALPLVSCRVQDVSQNPRVTVST